MAASVLYTNFGGMLVHEDRGGVHRTYAHDEMGNTSYLLDDNGITDSYEYTPYGTVRSHTGSSVTPFTFIGALGYFSTGLTHFTQYVRARWYSSKSGNWGAVDPLWPSQKPYAYVDGNPAMWVDPLGLTPKAIWKTILEVGQSCGMAIAGLLAEPILKGNWSVFQGSGGRLTLCKAGGACISALAALAVTGFLASSGIGSFFAGCLAGVVGSLLNDLFSALCDLFLPESPCYAEPAWECLLIDSLFRAAMGCLGGGAIGASTDPGQHVSYLFPPTKTGLTAVKFVNELRSLMLGALGGRGGMCH